MSADAIEDKPRRSFLEAWYGVRQIDHRKDENAQVQAIGPPRRRAVGRPPRPRREPGDGEPGRLP